ncbi:unnamed protein product [Rodentolepis nana]|uniref:NAD_Gly3P_dh_N domain-containing protein n=1 Tax=Rodentolepis nana TaxID=102285 RepID=A0A0R3T0C4_RODNA|nr:unnamed protein product [Rodentolepis nana]
MVVMKQVCVLGCGSMGTVLCNLVAERLLSLPGYNSKVLWYVRDEKYCDCDLKEHIRTYGENKKYLPGVKILENVVISDDAGAVAEAADVVLFAYATRHVTEILDAVKSHLKKDVLFVSFSKGLVVRESASSFVQPDIVLVSEEIRRVTGLESIVISGALTARGLAGGEFCEVTLGAKCQKDSEEIKQILHVSKTVNYLNYPLRRSLKNVKLIICQKLELSKIGTRQSGLCIIDFITCSLNDLKEVLY